MSLAAAVVRGDPIAAASAVALQHVSDEGPGITRHRRGKSFSYTDPRGRRVRDRATLARIRALAIDVRALRAIEPLVARYLDAGRRRRRA